MDGEGGEGLVPKEGGVGKVENLAEVVKVAKVAEQEREPSAFQLFSFCQLVRKQLQFKIR